MWTELQKQVLETTLIGSWDYDSYAACAREALSWISPQAWRRLSKEVNNWLFYAVQISEELAIICFFYKCFFLAKRSWTWWWIYLHHGGWRRSWGWREPGGPGERGNWWRRRRVAWTGCRRLWFSRLAGDAGDSSNGAWRSSAALAPGTWRLQLPL